MTGDDRELDDSPIEGESEQDRWQRNFADLLQELRVAQTGVQILFAFLLTLPFSAQFEETSAFQRNIYIVALLAAAAATAMIISPVAFHRALFRQGRKPELVRYAHRMATAETDAVDRVADEEYGSSGVDSPPLWLADITSPHLTAGTPPPPPHTPRGSRRHAAPAEWTAVSDAGKASWRVS